MKIRQLFQSTVHQPETLQVVFAAFDMAWADLEKRVLEEDREDARLRLATAMLGYVTENMTDPVELKDVTLAVYAPPQA